MTLAMVIEITGKVIGQLMMVDGQVDKDNLQPLYRRLLTQISSGAHRGKREFGSCYIHDQTARVEVGEIWFDSSRKCSEACARLDSACAPAFQHALAYRLVKRPTKRPQTPLLLRCAA